MDIIFEGSHDSAQAAENLMKVIRLFQERYHVGHFREMHLSMTLVDDDGEDVELVDTETARVYRTFEVYQSGGELHARRQKFAGHRLQLVVDNTRR